MVTFAPLPNLIDLIKASIPSTIDDVALAKPWCRDGDYPFWFSRSAWAMQAIIFWWKKYFGKNSPSFWIPDYFCNQSLWPVRQTSAKLFFYPIGENLQPKWELCKDLASQDPPDIFLLVHYFGYPSDAHMAKIFCTENHTILIEDAAHLLCPVSGVGEFGDFVFYSPHKLLAVPDGGLLICRHSSEYFQKINSEQALNTMSEVIKGMGQTLKFPIGWFVKRTLQKMMPYWLLNYIQKKRVPSFDEDFFPVAMQNHTGMNKISKRMLGHAVKVLRKVVMQRKRNESIIRYILGSKDGWQPYPQDMAKNIVPYLSVFQCENQDIAKAKVENLKSEGILVQSWPDLPPEVTANQDFHSTAINLRRTILTFPVHQSLNIYKLITAYGDKKYEINTSLYQKYEFVWNKVDQMRWGILLNSVEKSNLLQSWAYGDAKAKVEGWKVHRGLVLFEGREVAMLQTLEKALPILGGIIRINRGPLFFKNDISADEIMDVYALMRRQWLWKKRRILLIAPELQNISQNIVLLCMLGYRSRNSICWQSALLDLSKSEEELIKRLDGKWRNQLKFGERANLKLNVSCSEIDFHWLMDKYKDLMSKKGFKGISIDLLYSLRKHLQLKDHLLVMQAISGDEPIAGVLIVRHGMACTYLVGWNSVEGRRLKTHNFLLWRAVMEMKLRGCLWFDLGGIDDENVPGVARFKQGMCGEEYQLVGEWW